jgi:hypothetical protein
MKYILLLLLMYTAPARAQMVQDAQGNFTMIIAQAQSTGKTYTDAKGNIYPVMQSINGKLFIVRTSKTGKVYKQYLTVRKDTTQAR